MKIPSIMKPATDDSHDESLPSRQPGYHASGYRHLPLSGCRGQVAALIPFSGAAGELAAHIPSAGDAPSRSHCCHGPAADARVRRRAGRHRPTELSPAGLGLLADDGGARRSRQLRVRRRVAAHCHCLVRWLAVQRHPGRVERDLPAESPLHLRQCVGGDRVEDLSRNHGQVRLRCHRPPLV